MKVFTIFFIPIRNNVIALGLFTGLWSLLSLFFDAFILPSPLAVIRKLPEFWTDEFRTHFSITLVRTGAGFMGSFFLGTALGMVASILRIHHWVEPLLALFQVVPGLILGVVFLLMFGIGSTAPVALILFLTTPMIAVHTAGGMAKKNRVLEEVIRSFNGKIRRLVWDLYLPALIPTLRANAILGAVMAVKIVLLGEFIASDNGIGYLLNTARIYFNMAAVFFYLMVVLGMVVSFQIAVSGLFTLCFEKYLYPD